MRRMLRGGLVVLLGLVTVSPAGASFVTFETGQVRPLAMSPDGTRLFAVNTPDDRLEIFDIGVGTLTHVGSVPVGLEPVAIAARSNSEVWVVNHLSDSVSIVDVGSSPPASSGRCWSATSRATSCSRTIACSSPPRAAARMRPTIPPMW